MWGWLVTKIGGGVIGGFFKSYGIWIAIGAMVTALVSVVLYIHGAEKAKGKVLVLESQIKVMIKDYREAMDGYDTNKAALSQCLDANTANALEAARQAVKAKEAADKVALLRAELDSHVGEIHHDSETIRGRDTECRTVDQHLPDWFTVGLWD